MAHKKKNLHMKLSSPEKNAALLKVTSWTKFSKYFQCPYLSPLLCWGWCSRKLLLTQQIHWTRGQLLTLHPNLGELCHPLKAMNLKTFVHIDCKSKLHKAFRPIESHTSRAIHHTSRNQAMHRKPYIHPLLKYSGASCSMHTAGIYLTMKKYNGSNSLKF